MRSSERLTAVLALLVVGTVSVAILWMNGSAGTETKMEDPWVYLTAGVQLASTGEFAVESYRLDPPGVWRRVVTAVPPLTSAAFAALYSVGLPLYLVPAALNALMWVAYLVTTAGFARELGLSGHALSGAIVLAATTWPVINLYVKTTSEALFIPLLMGATWCLTHLARKPSPRIRGLALAALLMGGAALTRFAGAFFIVVVLGWWCARRRASAPRQLLRELVVLGSAGLPLALLLMRNMFREGTPVAERFATQQAPDWTLLDTARNLITQSAWFVFPTIRPGPLVRLMGWVPLVLVAVLVVYGAVRVVRARVETGRMMRVPETPVAPFIAFNYVFFGVTPFFMFLIGLVERYAAVLVALAIPVILAELLRPTVVHRRALAGAYVGLNLAFLAVFAFVQPGRLGHPVPFIEGPANYETSWDLLDAGVPAWLVHQAPRSGDLPTFLPRVAAYVAESPGNGIVTNAPDLFIAHPTLRSDSAVRQWIDGGSCVPSVTGPRVVIIDWNRWSVGRHRRSDAPQGRARDLVDAVAGKCPEASLAPLGPHTAVLDLSRAAEPQP